MFIYNLLIKPTVAAFCIMLSWGNQATINSYKWISSFTKKQIEAKQTGGRTQINQNIKSKGPIRIYQSTGNNSFELNDLKIKTDGSTNVNGNKITLGGTNNQVQFGSKQIGHLPAGTYYIDHNNKTLTPITS
jgi:hypothetical protein